MSALLPLSQKIKVKVFRQAKLLFENTFDHYPITFGRSKRAAIPLEFDFISRSHGVFTEENGKLFIIDLQSSNGISVDGKKVAKAEVHNQMQVKVGELVFQIEFAEVSKKTEPTATPTKQITVDTAVTMVGKLGLKQGNDTITEKITDREKKDLNLAARSIPAKTPPKPRHIEAPPKPQTQPKPKPQSQVQAKQTPSAVESQASAGIFLTEYHRQEHRIPRTHSGHEPRKPVLDLNLAPILLDTHPELDRARVKRVEAIVTWHDQIYDVKEFWRGESIVGGPLGRARLIVPTLSKPITLATFGSQLKCHIPKSSSCVLESKGNKKDIAQLVSENIATHSEAGFSLSCGAEDVVRIDLGNQTVVHLRYIPASPEIPGAKLFEPDESLRTSIITSLVMHGALALMLLLNAPTEDDVPLIKNVPKRYAKLLVEKPKPKPTPPPPVQKPTPLPKEVVKKKEPPVEKKVVKVKPKVYKIPKVISKRNKFPMEVKNPVPKAPPPVKLESLGALAALGQISKSAPKNVVTNININPNAGGLPTKSLSGGIVGALPSSNGKLVAAGGGPVKTKGMGYGTGQGYGIQGLKGTAGARGVAGAIVGKPQLAKASRAGEGLTRDQVMAVVKKHLGEIQHCYEKNLISSPGLKGRMEFEWDIEPGGNVSSTRIKRSTVDNGDALGECVKGIFAIMKFPRAKNGQGTTPTIGFPFGTL